jgi:hypothetical protein
LLLATGKTQTREAQPILHFLPKRSGAEGTLDPNVHSVHGRFGEPETQKQIVTNGKGQRRRCRENHAQSTAQNRWIHRIAKNVLAVQKDPAFQLPNEQARYAEISAQK